MPRYYKKSEDQEILEEIKAVVAIRATYGYRRITTMVNRLRTLEGRYIVVLARQELDKSLNSFGV
jgi:epoxyqueuosine reductase QueG